MELIVISNPIQIYDEHLIINELFENGLQYLHIRKPECSYKEINELINNLKPAFYDRIVLHQFHEMANDFDIKRLHYTEKLRKSLTVEEWQRKRDNGFLVSTSIHDYAMLTEIKNFDYMLFSPVFNSISKPNYQSKLPKDFMLDKTNINTKVIALGGVELSNLMCIKQMGFDGAAVLGTIWNTPEKAIFNFNQLIKNLPA